MKKFLLYLLIFSGALTATAQNSIRNWERGTNASSPLYSWFSTTTGNNSSCAYNPATDRLYVVDRTANVYILNADGTEYTTQPTLNKTGIPSGNVFQKIRVTPTGEIFAVLLRTSTVNGNTFVWYWSSESAVPVQLGNTVGGAINTGTGITLNSERAGDAFAVSGSGQNVVLYFGGNAAAVVGPPAIPAAVNLQVVNKNGPTTADFVKVNNITVATSGARTGISPVTTGITSDFWITGPTIQTRLITSTGSETKVLPGTQLTAPGTTTPANSISNRFSHLEYFEIVNTTVTPNTTKKFLTTAVANDNVAVPTGEGLLLHIYDITDFNNIFLVESTKLTGPYVANGNSTGDIALKRVLNGNGTTTMTFFQLVTNNGLASYSLTFNPDGTLPVTLTSFTAAIVNNKNTLTWETASERNNLGFEIESSTDGQQFSKIGFVPAQTSGNSNSVLKYSFQDNFATAGTTYYRLKQIDKDGKFEYFDVKFIKNPFLTSQNTFKVYPNPVTSYIDIDGVDAEGISVKLFNTSGTEINRVLEKGRLNMSDLDAGIYILRISKNGTLLQTTKVVKQ